MQRYFNCVLPVMLFGLLFSVAILCVSCLSVNSESVKPIAFQGVYVD